MSFDETPPRLAALVGLGALVPAAAFALGHADVAGVVAAVNVVLIVGSLFRAMTSERGDDAPSDDSAA